MTAVSVHSPRHTGRDIWLLTVKENGIEKDLHLCHKQEFESGRYARMKYIEKRDPLTCKV
jgi:hypothetical protein